MNRSRNRLLAVAVHCALIAAAQPAWAKSAKSSDKDARIEALEQRLLQLEQRLIASETRNAELAAAKPAEKLADAPSVKQLDQKVKVLERKLEVEKEVADAAKKTAPKLEAGPEGVKFSSADGENTVRLRGALQTDAKFFMDDNAKPFGTAAVPVQNPVGGEANGINLPDRFELKQARVWLEGTLFKHFDFKIMPDFGKNGGTLLQDAYVDAHYFPYASLNVGKQKTPLSLERLQGDSDGTFLERAYPTQLASNRDVGVMLHGSFAKPGYSTVYGGPVDFKNFVSYQLGVFNGSGDNGAASNLGDTTKQDDKEFAGRLWAHPFQHSGIEFLDGLGVGIAGSWEQPNQKNLPSNLTSANGGNAIVNYTTNNVSKLTSSNSVTFSQDNDHYRVYPQAYWYYGPFGAIGEYVVSSQQLTGIEKATAGATNGKVIRSRHLQQDNHAWQALVSYVVTGEDNTFQGVKPRANFDPLNGNWGALQLAARWSQLDIDDSSFQNLGTAAKPFQFLDPSKSVSKATAWALGANWYLNRNALIRADYEQTYFQGGAGLNATKVHDRPTEKVFSTRFQLAF